MAVRSPGSAAGQGGEPCLGGDGWAVQEKLDRDAIEPLLDGKVVSASEKSPYGGTPDGLRLIGGNHDPPPARRRKRNRDFAMGLFQKKQTIRENRIENVGRWPIRQTDFFLVDDYEFPPSRYLEIFYVRSGNFLHETENGTQAVRAGTAMVHHPASRHVIKHPDQVKLTRVRFLPEWFAGDSSTILAAPDVLGLFFSPIWFQLPLESSLQVFTCRESQQPFLVSLLDLLHQGLRTGRHLEPVSRVALLEVLMLFGDEYHVYWRGGNRLYLPEEVTRSLDLIEHSISSGGRLPLKLLQTTNGASQDELNQAFRKHLGMALIEFAQARRVQYSAQRLLASSDSVEEVAGAFGFSDPSQLEKAFDSVFGMIPDVYRQKYGSGQPAKPKDAESPA